MLRKPKTVKKIVNGKYGCLYIIPIDTNMSLHKLREAITDKQFYWNEVSEWWNKNNSENTWKMNYESHLKHTTDRGKRICSGIFQSAKDVMDDNFKEDIFKKQRNSKGTKTVCYMHFRNWIVKPLQGYVYNKSQCNTNAKNCGTQREAEQENCN